MMIPSLLLALCASLVFAGTDTAPPAGVAYCNASEALVDNSGLGYKLLKVVVVTRHGDRTPVWTFDIPDDTVAWNCTLNLQIADGKANTERSPTTVFKKQYIEDREMLKGNCYFGQLTQRGADQHQGVGGHMKALYIDTLGFLGATLDPSEIALRSTDVERTLLSAYNLVKGMWPLSRPPVLSIAVIDGAKDNASPNGKLCPALWRTTGAIQNSTKFTSYFETNLGPLAAKYGALWNISALKFDDFQALNDISRARFCHGLPLPTGWNMDDTVAMWHAIRVLYNMKVDSFDAQRFGSGAFMQDILASFSLPEKFQLFSAHDSTLRSLIYAMVQEPDDLLEWPAYASHFTMEAWQTGADEIVIGAQFNGKMLQLKEPCASTFCSMTNFQALMQKYAVTAEECK